MAAKDLATSLQQDHADKTAVPIAHHGAETAGVQAAATVTMPEGSALDSSVTFAPADITTNRGDTVVWRNDDTLLHTVESVEKGLFASDLLSPNKTFAHTFAEPGMYKSLRTLHLWMEGKITVR